jgi:hypothetical protein
VDQFGNTLTYSLLFLNSWFQVQIIKFTFSTSKSRRGLVAEAMGTEK